jgi:hypothetical protein
MKGVHRPVPTALCLAILLSVTSVVDAAAVAIPEVGSPRDQAFQITLLWNTHRLTAMPELSGTSKPISVIVHQNLLSKTERAAVLDEVAFDLEIHALGQNAPAVASSVGVGVSFGGVKASLSCGGISSLETNAWRTRAACSWEHGSLSCTFMADIIGLLEPLGTSWYIAAGAQTTWRAVKDNLELTLEGRFATVDRWETGCTIAVQVRRWTLMGALVYRRLPSRSTWEGVGGLSLRL